MTRPRAASGQLASKTVCGRRHCRTCRRWRHVIDFGVRQWADTRRTIVRYHKPECMVCAARLERARFGRLSEERRRARRAQMRDAYHVRARVWTNLGSSLIEELPAIGYGGASGSAHDPIPAHVARAWAEEMPSPERGYTSGWWKA